ncbi:hypothetical protein TWF788_010241 [Orbilia oligospora]|uniref:Uncharacterized protein n=1 Tax=Orbilia oligospora TaxID=2813651 RepID=A0A7C8PFJ7_ORBOL|nr:hypothetical protein TWF788_010241 [Orbilia oligospora]
MHKKKWAPLKGGGGGVAMTSLQEDGNIEYQDVRLGGFEPTAIDSLADWKEDTTDDTNEQLGPTDGAKTKKEGKSNKRKSGDIFFFDAWYRHTLHIISDVGFNSGSTPGAFAIDDIRFDRSLAKLKLLITKANFNFNFNLGRTPIGIKFAVGKICSAEASNIPLLLPKKHPGRALILDGGILRHLPAAKQDDPSEASPAAIGPSLISSAACDYWK